MNLEEYIREHYSPNGVRGYLSTIRKYREYMGEKTDTAKYGDIMEYIGHLRSRKLHPKSIRNHLHGIKIYYSYLQADKQREDHPCKYLYLKDRIDRQIHIESLYSREELQSFYNSFKEGKEKIIAGFLVYQALTVQEISNLRTGDLDLENGTVLVRESVQNRSRTLSLKPNQILQLQRHMENLSDGLLLLNELGEKKASGEINRMINKGQKKKLLPLKIRQSVISHLLKEQYDVRIVQAFAGHRRTGSTESYKQNGLDELKAAIGKYHPLQ